MTETQQFCQILRERSSEHVSAATILFENRNYGQIVSILRQELDSLVRTVYLLSKDLYIRHHLIDQMLQNVRWTLPNSRATITDEEMVSLTERLHGWTNSVYKLGCAFIHLSPLVDYKNSNPFSQLDRSEVDNIKQHLHRYHDFSLIENLTMTSIEPYLLKVLKKVSDNLSCYIDDLENDRIVIISNI